MKKTPAIFGLLILALAVHASAAIGIGPRDLHRQLVPQNPVKTWGKVTSTSPLRISDGAAEIQVTGLSGLSIGDYVWAEGDWDRSVLTVSQEPRKAKAYRSASRTNMIYIPAGSFVMGDDGPQLDEHPEHSVYLSGYWIGKHEVTRGEFRQFIDAGGYSNPTYWSSAGWNWRVSQGRTQPSHWEAVQNWGSPPGSFTQTDKHPVVGVSYYEAEAFCSWAGGHLPTEAQWEKAARWTGTSSNYYPWGLWNAELSNNWYDSLYPCSQTAPVGSYPGGASPYGCQDMAGNVLEWCKDWYGDTYYAQPSAGSDPQGPSSGSSRVRRGGGWGSDGYYVRCDVRNFGGPNYDSQGIGFRFASDVETVFVPGTPTGVQSPAVNTNVLYVTYGSMCNWGHEVEYSFHWGDGTSSPWSTSISASHSWSTTGEKTIVVAARCQAHPGVSAVSSGLIVNVVSTPTLGEMIHIPAGSFLMGNSGVGDDLAHGSSVEFPQHSVYLSEYWIGKYEVTRGEYRQFMEAGGYSNPIYWSIDGWSWRVDNSLTEPRYWAPTQTWKSGQTFTQTDNYPVVGVSYHEAVAFCNWAGGHPPTEAQWERAARWDAAASHPNIYPWGDTWDWEKCNCYADHNLAGGGYLRYQTSPVGNYATGASSYGCMDMAGNVAEWCSDWFQMDYYSQTPGSGWSDPQGPSGGYQRIMRGGNWYDSDLDCRCASRLWGGPDFRTYNLGFRLARDLERMSVFVGTPSGDQAPYVDASQTYTTSGAISFWGHAVEYSFDWGDGTSSPWSTSTSASHAWSTAGDKTVTVTARCQAHPGLSSTSAGLAVTVFDRPNVGEMILIPAGSFLMGNSGAGDDLTRSLAEELPQHSVYLPEYWIGKYEVTRGEYRQFIDAGGYSNPAYWSSDGWDWKVSLGRTEPDYWAVSQDWAPPGGALPQPFTQTDYHPVVGVAYYEAEAFCNWAGGHLPTEAQWEKAARWDAAASHPNVYPWGDEVDGGTYNCYGDPNPAGGGSLRFQTAPVGSYPSGASPYGCHDMVGNASEWVQDWYKSYPGSTSPFDFTDTWRVIRGGDFMVVDCRCAARGCGDPHGGSCGSGFRLVR